MSKPTIQSGGFQDYTLTSMFTAGYRNREDKTILPPGILVTGSQNVLTNTAQRIGNRKGYILDGAADTSNAPILSSFDWQNRAGERNLRAGFLSGTNNGMLQYRYLPSGTTVANWRNLSTGLTSVSMNFCTFWDFNKELKDFCLFVDGSTNVYEWSGGITTVSSAALNAITKSGTTTWAEENFYNLNYTLGDSTTQFDITNPSGTTFRYTYDGTGTDPGITSTLLPTGMTLNIQAQNFTAANNGVFTVTGSGTNYFEVTNAAGVAENNKTIGTGYIDYFVNQVVINGVTYTYHGGGDTTTITGVTPDPQATVVAGDIVHQKVKTYPAGGITSFPSSFDIDLIENFQNQIYYGNLTNNSVYVSKTNNYKNVAFTSPVRAVGEGARLTLDGYPVGFKPQENSVYISAGQDQWYEVAFTLSADLSSEALTVKRLKTTAQQGAQSQAFITKIKNSVAFLSFEPILNTLGRVDNVVLTPQITDLSFPIINDMVNYDFTNGSVFYHQNFLYLAVPAENLFRMYNMTDPQNPYWEAPQTIPISRFAIIGGELYGHSYLTSETYKLFTGYNDNGLPYNAVAKFSFNNYGSRSSTKAYNQFFNEGYISPNTTLTLGIQHEIDGCARSLSYNLSGNNTQYVCRVSNDASLGKTSYGWHGLGTSSQTSSANTLPPKFRWIRTFPIDYFYEDQITYSSTGADQNWEILAFGPQLLKAKDLNNFITE